MTTMTEARPSETRHWTHVYRRAWMHLRGGIAWTLLGWALAAFHPDDPVKVEMARSLLWLSDREARRL
jgi:hypothetical protein